MMKNSKLKFSDYMQNISRSKGFGKFVLIVLTKGPILFTFTVSQLDLNFFLVVAINQKARNGAKKSQTLILLINTRLITPRLDFN